MVRLKETGRLFAFHPFLRFNSTMVRLKVPDAYINGAFDLFQFHYGTIKRY